MAERMPFYLTLRLKFGFYKPNYQRKAQAPYNKINQNSVITEFKNSPVIGWVLVALDAKVRQCGEPVIYRLTLAQIFCQ